MEAGFHGVKSPSRHIPCSVIFLKIHEGITSNTYKMNLLEYRGQNYEKLWRPAIDSIAAPEARYRNLERKCAVEFDR